MKSKKMAFVLGIMVSYLVVGIEDLLASTIAIAIIFIPLGTIFYLTNKNISNKEEKIKKVFSDQNNFNVTHQFIGDENSIAVDSNSQKIIFYEKKVLTKINFDDLISVETKINDMSLHQTQRGSQIVGGAIGGLLLGPAGLLIGALSGKKTSIQKITKVSIKITISNIDKPFFELIFYDGFPIQSDGLIHNSFSKQADEWIARLSVIISSK